MAGVYYDGTLNEVKEVVIAGNKVTSITHETAQVGCTKVTRAEAEALLAEMNKVPETKDFEITRDSKDKYFLTFSVRHSDGGWLATNPNANAPVPGGGYSAQALFLCLTNERAEKLLKFLTEQLGYVAYKLSSGQKFIIEYKFGENPWQRSGNASSKGEFASSGEAQVIADDVRKQKGAGYTYRVRPL